MKQKVDGNSIAVDFILGTTWEAVPQKVQEQAKMCLLDTLGSVLSGTLAPISRIMSSYASEHFSGNQASILLYGKRATAVGAAMANAYAGNALDIDDGSPYTRGHPGAQVFPTSLAVAEKVNASGKDLLEALVVGYEIALLTGRCWYLQHEVWQADGSWGSVACAAAAARLMKLDGEKVKQALGIADYHAPNLPMMRDIDHPSMVKHGIGWGAMTGTISAELAQRGFTAVPSILGFEEYAHWVKNLGKSYLMADGISFKRWCSCGWGHSTLTAAEGIVKKNKIEAKTIEKIEVYTFHQASRLYQQAPTTTEEAQFSVKWPLASLLIDGEVGPRQILEPYLQNREKQELVRKIEIIEDSEINGRFQRYQEGIDSSYAPVTSQVVITMQDGRIFDSGIVGENEDYRWSEQKIKNKFRWISGNVLEMNRIERLIDIVWNFDAIRSVKELIDILA